MSSGSREAPVRIRCARLPTVLILCLIICTTVAVPASAAAVIQKLTPVPNATASIVPVISPTTTAGTPAPTLITTIPTKASAEPAITPQRTLLPVRTQLTITPAAWTTETTEPDLPDPGRQIEYTSPVEELPGDILRGDDLDYDSVESPYGDILLETASDQEEILPVGNGEGEESEGENVFVGKFLVSDAKRQLALAALQEEDTAIFNISGDENSVSVETEKHAKIFGIFSTAYTETLTIDRSGQVTVGEPWWLGFSSPGEMDAIDRKNTLQKQQQLIQTLSNVAKMLGDTAVNSTRKIG